MKPNQEKKNKKKEVFSKDIDARISSYALSFMFIVCGLVLQFVPAYFGNAIITEIVKWVFIVLGFIAFSVQVAKNKIGIVGVDTLFVGILFLGVWFALFWFGKHWIFNTIGFFCLIFGAFGFFQGLQQVVYSASKIPKAKTEEKSKEKTRTDILLFLTKLFGVVLVVVQIIKAVMDLST